MTAERARRTDAELEAAYRAVPETMVGEILGGDLVVSPRPTSFHATATMGLAEELGGPFRRGKGGPGGWVILVEPEVHLGPRPDKLVPDLAGWRRGRMPETPDVAAFALPPDWACEVLSPSTERIDRVAKRRIYAREGVGHLWLVDPRIETVEVYRLHEGHWLEVETFAGSTRVRAEPFDAVEIDLGALWIR